MKGKLLDIEWKHLEVAGETCDRCAGTIVNIRQVLENLRKSGLLKGWRVQVRETPLTPDKIVESNQVLINGINIEEILSAGVQDTSCPSCASLAGQPSCCRAIEIEGEVYEEIPAILIESAILIVLGKK